MSTERKTCDHKTEGKDKSISKHLDLSNQGFSKLPMSLINGYASIKRLYLESNLLSALPEEIFSILPYLSWLDIRNNLLIYLPKSIANHPSLEVLLLQGNQLQELPVELGIVPNLRGLQISDNPITFPPKDVIQKGIHSILSFLRNECKACSKDSTEEPKESHCHNNEQSLETLENKDKIENFPYEFAIRRNTAPCNQDRTCFPSRRRRATMNEHPKRLVGLYKNEDNTLESSPEQILPMCKSAIRVMTNPKKSLPLITRKSAPNPYRRKSGCVLDTKHVRNATSSRNKQLVMKQEAIIQKKKNEEALKSWRDKMQNSKEKKTKSNHGNLERNKNFPYGIDPEHMKMPSRASLQTSSLSKIKNTGKCQDKTESSSEIDSELCVIFKTLQDLKNIKENPINSPKTEKKASEEKLIKITELQAAIVDLKRRNSQRRIVKLKEK